MIWETLTLEFANEHDLPTPMRQLAQQVTKATFDATNITGTVTLQICTDEEMRQLNHKFRHVNKGTDVLSFPTRSTIIADAPKLLGDVAISYHRSVCQGHSFGHGIHREFAYLLTHAILHLGGHTHDGIPNFKMMRELEEEILTSIGLGRGQAPTA